MDRHASESGWDSNAADFFNNVRSQPEIRGPAMHRTFPSNKLAVAADTREKAALKDLRDRFVESEVASLYDQMIRWRVGQMLTRAALKPGNATAR